MNNTWEKLHYSAGLTVTYCMLCHSRNKMLNNVYLAAFC